MIHKTHAHAHTHTHMPAHSQTHSPMTATTGTRRLERARSPFTGTGGPSFFSSRTRSMASSTPITCTGSLCFTQKHDNDHTNTHRHRTQTNTRTHESRTRRTKEYAGVGTGVGVKLSILYGAHYVKLILPFSFSLVFLPLPLSFSSSGSLVLKTELEKNVHGIDNGFVSKCRTRLETKSHFNCLIILFVDGLRSDKVTV